MNIHISPEYRRRIKKAAKDSGKSVEDFIIESAVQAAKDSQYNLNLKEEVYSFIKEQIPSIRNHANLVFVELKKVILNKYFLILLFITLFCILISLLLTKSLVQNESALKVFVIIVLFLMSCLSFALMLGSINIIVFYNSIGKKKIRKRYIRIETNKNISLTQSFARKLSKEYSLIDLKIAEEDLKEIIDGKENTLKIYYAGTILFSILLLWLIGEASVEISKYLEDSFSDIVGGLSFVFFSSALLTFILNLNYFNDLVFYKKGVSALRQAQISIEK